MKKIILFLTIFIPAFLLAQTEFDKKDMVMDEQVKEWMNKISSDSDLRSQMVDMMFLKIKGNKEEMVKLIDSFTSDSEVNKMIMANMPKKAATEFSLQPRESMRDTIRDMQMKNVKPVPQKVK